MWYYDRIIIGYWFESSNVLYYNPEIRYKLNKYNCVHLFKYLANLLVCIYIIIFPFIALKYAGYKYKQYNVSYFQMVQFYLRNPLTLFTQGTAVYNGMIINHIRNIQLTDLVGFMDKLYWDKLFRQNNVCTPNIIGYIIDGKPILQTQLEDTCSYIIKPIHGYQGRQIQSYNITEDYSKMKDDFIIQQKVSFDYINVATHLRCITAFKNDELSLCMLYLCINPCESKIASNSGGATWFIIKNDKMRAVDTNEWINVPIKPHILQQCIDQSLKLHQTFIERQIPLNSIAFDIIIHNETPYFLEGNLFYGLIENDIDFINTFDNYINCIM